MPSNLDPSITSKIANEMIALQEGVGPLEAELRQELGRLSFTTTIIHEAVESAESAAANYELAREFTRLLPRADLGSDHSGPFFLNAKDVDVQYQARKLQANVLWLPGEDSKQLKGLDSKARLHPAYILGRRQDPQRADAVELLLSPNLGMPHSQWDTGVKVIKVLKEDLAVLDSVVATSEAKDFREDQALSMITKDGTFRIDAKSPGSFIVRKKTWGKSNADTVQTKGIRLASGEDRGILLDGQISDSMMEEFGVAQTLANLAQSFNVRDKLKDLLVASHK